MRAPHREERGSVLVEFALVMLVVHLLLAATLDFGRALAMQQVIQNAARATARELALTPAPADSDFRSALAAIFDDHALVIDLDALAGCGQSVDARLTKTLNRLLRPAMIVERLSLDGRERSLLRYPGALLRNPDYGGDPCRVDDGEFTVAIPKLDASGVVTWVEVVEEVLPGAFALSSSEAGVAWIRVHYPFQAATLSAFRNGPDESGAGNLGSVIVAEPISAPDPLDEDGRVLGRVLEELDVESPASGGAGARTTPYRPYAGALGLGRQAAFGTDVRPFRRLLSADAFFRREVLL